MYVFFLVLSGRMREKEAPLIQSCQSQKKKMEALMKTMFPLSVCGMFGLQCGLNGSKIVRIFN